MKIEIAADGGDRTAVFPWRTADYRLSGVEHETALPGWTAEIAR